MKIYKYAEVRYDKIPTEEQLNFHGSKGWRLITLLAANTIRGLFIAYFEKEETE